MNRIRYNTIIQAITFLMILSCSQKYDDNGIFSDDDIRDSTFSTIGNDTVVCIGKSYFNDGNIYIGKKEEGSDTLSWAESMFKFVLPDTTDLDTSYVLYRINSKDSIHLGKGVNVYKVSKEWASSDSVISIPEGRELYGTVYFNSDSLTLGISDSLYLEHESGDTISFMFANTDSAFVTPVTQLYSSKWSYESQRPVIRSVYSFPDTVTTENGDSTFTVYEHKSDFVNDDISFGYKEPSFLEETVSDEFLKIGGVSGESYTAKIDLSEIPQGSKVLDARICLKKEGDRDDPVYGGLDFVIPEGDNVYKPEIYIHILQNSDWHTLDYSQLDEYYRWEYEIEGELNYFTMETAIQNWIEDPDSNHGFLITANIDDCKNAFGSSVFEKPEIDIIYIIYDDE
ncbi:MAG: hypothetical protein R6V47_07225 [Candidatus Delongbacteria bacterium]